MAVRWVHLSRVPARLLAPELPLRRTGETWVYRGVQGVYREVDFRGLLLFLLYVRLNSCFLSLELGQRVMGPIGQSKGGYPFLARRASLYHWAPPFCFRLRSVPPLLSRSSLVARRQLCTLCDFAPPWLDPLPMELQMARVYG
jgi:hypothetical protein